MCLLVICVSLSTCFFFFKQKTAYEMRISDWSSDVCSSDLPTAPVYWMIWIEIDETLSRRGVRLGWNRHGFHARHCGGDSGCLRRSEPAHPGCVARQLGHWPVARGGLVSCRSHHDRRADAGLSRPVSRSFHAAGCPDGAVSRSEGHTSELQ